MHYNNNYKPPDKLVKKLDPYFISLPSLTGVNGVWAILKSDAPANVREAIKDFKNETSSASVHLFWKKVKTDEEIAVVQADYQRKQVLIELKNGFENMVIENREREVEKAVNKALPVLDASIASSCDTPIASSPCNASTTPQQFSHAFITTSPPRYTPTTPPCNTSIPPSSLYTPTTSRHNDSITSLSLSLNILKRSLDIYETSYEMDWAPWKFDITINNVKIERVLRNLHEKCQKTKPKTKTSLEYGIIDLNNSIILEALGQSVISHFETKMQGYKPKKALSVEVRRILKTFNVTSLEDLGKALDKVKIDHNNLDRDIIYLYRLFQKFFLLFQDKATINLDNRDLPEGWYNSHIVAPIFDDCLESMDQCILRRSEVESFVQKLLDKKSRKKRKYDGILSFSRQFEFIYVETAATSVLSKSDKDLSKLHNAIILMFKHMVSTLPEKLLHEISSMPVLCVQFSGASVEVYLAIWLANMRPIVFSIMDFEIAEEITTFPKMTKVAAKMLSLRPFIQGLHKRYQTLLTKEADYYLDDDNTWASPIRMKARH
ncbi:5839_t:CDS:10 [Paraglomus occultum]|uniref:5839_t:CDS:1 n=1 Tax=Paraglomus occultum TaxID=144539 RepID=A0A9N9C7J7_9GLOM|nr:5839_t:CDS:10 [Paraglomus occultum]